MALDIPKCLDDIILHGVRNSGELVPCPKKCFLEPLSLEFHGLQLFG